MQHKTASSSSGFGSTAASAALGTPKGGQQDYQASNHKGLIKAHQKLPSNEGLIVHMKESFGGGSGIAAPEGATSGVASWHKRSLVSQGGFESSSRVSMHEVVISKDYYSGKEPRGQKVG